MHGDVDRVVAIAVFCPARCTPSVSASACSQVMLLEVSIIATSTPDSAASGLMSVSGAASCAGVVSAAIASCVASAVSIWASAVSICASAEVFGGPQATSVPAMRSPNNARSAMRRALSVPGALRCGSRRPRSCWVAWGRSDALRSMLRLLALERATVAAVEACLEVRDASVQLAALEVASKHRLANGIAGIQRAFANADAGVRSRAIGALVRSDRGWIATARAASSDFEPRGGLRRGVRTESDRARFSPRISCPSSPNSGQTRSAMRPCSGRLPTIHAAVAILIRGGRHQRRMMSSNHLGQPRAPSPPNHRRRVAAERSGQPLRS